MTKIYYSSNTNTLKFSESIKKEVILILRVFFQTNIFICLLAFSFPDIDMCLPIAQNNKHSSLYCPRTKLYNDICRVCVELHFYITLLCTVLPYHLTVKHSALHCTALHCLTTALFKTLHFNVLPSSEVHNCIQHFAALHYNALHRSALHFTVKHSALPYTVLLLHCSILYSLLYYPPVQCTTL